MSLAKRSVTSIGWNVGVSVVQVAVGFVRYFLLRRWLPVRVFGVYSMATSIVTLSAVVAGFGMADALLHRAPETQDEEESAAVHFTLKSIFVAVWILLVLAGAFLFTNGPDRLALIVISVTQSATLLANTPTAILMRRVVHRRLALLQFSDIVLSSGVAFYLAWSGAGLWALLSTNVITMILTIFLMFLWRPVWRPRLTWKPDIMRYFLRFGSRNVLAKLLLQALNHIDDLWTGTYLGRTQLGYYSSAYSFATYPRTILASSVNKVATGTYAELAHQRKSLSQAFFRTNAFLVRTGFLIAGLLALVAPEFIRILLDETWLPMVNTFRLMLIFTLLDPIKVTVANLFVAVGKPEKVARARGVQLIVLVAGLFALGPTFGIDGVAVAADLMLLVGMAILLRQAREYVDFSLLRLFGIPLLALSVALLLGWQASLLPQVPHSDWWTGGVKAIVFSVVYGSFIALLEGRQMLEMLRFFGKRILSPSKKGTK